MSNIYIHYGSKKFNEKKFEQIKNINFVKPKGGLWASNINSKYGWKSWTERENFRVNEYNDNNFFKFKIKDESKVLVITDSNQLDKLPKAEKFKGFFDAFTLIDFEKLSKKYDAIEVLFSEEKVNMLNYTDSLYYKLYGWDCDSILVMNKDAIEIIY